ncbi:MAG: hypothetical protein ACJ74Y_06105 [Bryobacteraceae bacterium]
MAATVQRKHGMVLPGCHPKITALVEIDVVRPLNKMLGIMTEHGEVADGLATRP